MGVYFSDRFCVGCNIYFNGPLKNYLLTFTLVLGILQANVVSCLDGLRDLIPFDNCTSTQLLHISDG